MSSLIQFIVFLILASFLEVRGHIALQEPPQRASLWRDPRFAEFNPPVHPDDTSIYCGPVNQPPEVDNCGVCGDRLTDPTPRENEHGGVYGRGIIAGNYSSGEEIVFNAFLRINHGGSYYAELCDELPESEACFTKFPHLMINVDGVNSDLHPVPAGSNVWANGTMTLPAGASCRNCVLRLSYRGTDQTCPGRCDCNDTLPPGSETCRLQQNYRNCADISIAL